MAEDQLGAVIRAHLYVEAQVNGLLHVLVPYPEHLEEMRLNWGQRVELVLAMGLKPQYGPPLKVLGRIRNKFAHDPDAELTKEDVNELYGCLRDEDREIVLESFRLTKSQVPDPVKGEFRDLEIKSQFTLIVVALHALLLVVVREARDNYPGHNKPSERTL